MKPCPFCAEEIQDAAIKCRHCGSSLSGAIQPVAPPAPQPPLQPVAAPVVHAPAFQPAPAPTPLPRSQAPQSYVAPPSAVGINRVFLLIGVAVVGFTVFAGVFMLASGGFSSNSGASYEDISHGATYSNPPPAAPTYVPPPPPKPEARFTVGQPRTASCSTMFTTCLSVTCSVKNEGDATGAGTVEMSLTATNGEKASYNEYVYLLQGEIREVSHKFEGDFSGGWSACEPTGVISNPE